MDGPGALFRPVGWDRWATEVLSPAGVSPWAEIEEPRLGVSPWAEIEDDTEEPRLVWLIELELLPALCGLFLLFRLRPLLG